MNFSRQLKKYRELAGFSQDILAEKIYVTRQTISKWENDHTYPDIHNLIALSALFDVTLDELIKGDVEMMRNNSNVAQMDKLTWVMLIFILLGALTALPLTAIWSWYGLILPIIFLGIGTIAAFKIEKIKKASDIKTFAEILAFTEGRDVSGPRKQRNKVKDFWSKTLIVVGFSGFVGLITWLSGFLWELLF
ncbi:helix-turn-helix domain-containing protein [Vagococcus salmoninarum]|uniref:helix-turn-helix domain-containing protein n=1 Tax=Vagococcus salmoninarum TaxID=2739 RepID=UPI0018827BCA|nr:helix-turn-helix transcriptional regulator [Vagococcus salmoninarum]MBE9389933.1 helix-turn-helix transcriptional regulator [Vagococcus salmoninarum]